MRFSLSPAARTVLWWCLPALLLGLVLRTVLWIQMPSAFYHPDSDQVFETYRSLTQGVLRFHEKKTPLGPLLYCLPFLLHLPPLPAFAFGQHLLGLVLVGMVGALVALSFVRWRLFIVPVTVAVAVNPVLLWYEHVALPETFYVTSLVALALAGLLYRRQPSWGALIGVGVALFAVAGLRPEGKLFFLFGLALTGWCQWGRWHRQAQHTGSLTLLMVFCLLLNRTAQSGSLLYSNVAHLTPEHLYSAPGFAEQNRAYFEGLRARWESTPAGGVVRERKQMAGLARAYLKAHQQAGKPVGSDESFCGRLGMEICLRNAFTMPAFALTKFRFALPNSAAEDFGPDWLFRKQVNALDSDLQDEEGPKKVQRSAATPTKLLYGREFQSQEELESFLREVYHPFSPDWLSAWQSGYAAGVLAWRLPDRPFGKGTLHGVPYLYLAAVAGLIAMAWRNPLLRNYHVLWLAMLLFMAFVLALTGSNLGRFRLGFEPFWWLYAFALLDSLISLVLKENGTSRSLMADQPTLADTPSLQSD